MKPDVTGAFLFRGQPLHNAHLYMIAKALAESERAVLILGSSNKANMLRNPYPFDLRMEMLRSSLSAEDMERLIIFELPDWSREDKYEDVKLWGRYLYYNMVSRSQSKHFKFYYNDDPEIMRNWFRETEVEPFIDFSFIERDTCFDGLSSTKIREAFATGDKSYIAKYCPSYVYTNFDKLAGIWLQVRESPRSDFSMGETV